MGPVMKLWIEGNYPFEGRIPCRTDPPARPAMIAHLPIQRLSLSVVPNKHATPAPPAASGLGVKNYVRLRFELTNAKLYQFRIQ